MIFPNVTSIQYAFARIREPWDDAIFVSVHGRGLKGAKTGLIGTLSARGDKEAQAAIKACVAEGGEVGEAAALAVATLGGAQ